MSRKGNCWDNAVSEIFFGTLKTELEESFPTRAIARAKLFDYIEVFYNRQRFHLTLNTRPPRPTKPYTRPYKHLLNTLARYLRGGSPHSTYEKVEPKGVT